MIKAVLFDVDDTLLSFSGYVKEAMREGFSRFGLTPYSDAMFPVLKGSNRNQGSGGSVLPEPFAKGAESSGSLFYITRAQPPYFRSAAARPLFYISFFRNAKKLNCSYCSVILKA